MVKLLDIIATTPGLKYHLKHKLPISENIYRYSSDAFVELFEEARQLWKTGMLELPLPDVDLLENTDIGKWGVYEGQKVPLDLPMEYENNYEPILEDIRIYGKIYENINIEDSYPIETTQLNSINGEFIFTDKHGVQRKLQYFEGGSVKVLWYDDKERKWSVDKMPSKFEDEKVLNTFGKILIKGILPRFGSFSFVPTNTARYRLFRALIFSNLDKSLYDMTYDDQSMEIEVFKKQSLDEAEYKGKKVQLSKPKRGGPKKFFVYVKNPKTGKIKKVNFGAKEGGQSLAVKFKEPGARASFAARHNCKDKNDKTTPGYWSCRIPRYWKSLGGSSNFSGFW